MDQNKQPNPTKNTVNSGTNPQKVKQEIKEDVSHGIGAMTSREAGATRD